MFINKTKNGRNNFCGTKITKFRHDNNLSQREFANRLQLIGMDVDKNAIQRMESGQRFITDIEIVFLCKVMNLNFNEIFDFDNV